MLLMFLFLVYLIFIFELLNIRDLIILGMGGNVGLWGVFRKVGCFDLRMFLMELVSFY